MKRLFPILLICALLCGCGSEAFPPTTAPATEPTPAPEAQPHPALAGLDAEEIPYASRFDTETRITLSDGDISVTGVDEDGVFASHDIICRIRSTPLPALQPCSNERDLYE